MNMETMASPVLTEDEKYLFAQHFLSVLRDQNWHIFTSLLTDDVVWKMPGNTVLSGAISGKAGVVEAAKILMSFDPFFHLTNIQSSYSGFALWMQMQAHMEGNILNQETTIVCTLAGNKIAAISFFLSDLHNLKDFFKGGFSYPDGSVAAAEKWQNQTIIANTFLAAMKANDWDRMSSIMQPDLQWTLPGKSLLSGPADGVSAVTGRARSLKKFGVMFELLHVLHSWDSVALSLHNTANRDGLILDEFVTIVFAIEDEKIAGMTTHLSDVPGIEAFFIPGIID